MKILLKTLLLSICLIALTSVAFAQVHVRGYTRKDGTYVQPHYRSSPDGSRYNNWSTRGNVNPYTGAAGTKNIDGYNSRPSLTPRSNYNSQGYPSGNRNRNNSFGRY